jgi:dipeptidyl aminopeptidase/acylaminoacyl peptidase
MTRRLALLALLAGLLVAVPGPHDAARAAFPGKNGQIAFVRAVGAGPLEEVFVVSPASGLTANLSNDPAASDTAPAWSPDGTRVAFQRSGPGDGIWSMDATGGGLDFVPHTDHGFQPTWSPDGGRIAFSREGPGGTTRIVVLDLEGGGEAAVTQAGGFDQAPDWSPDGTRIAFNRFLPGQGNRVFTVAPAARPSPSAPSAAPTTSTRPGPRTGPGSPSPAAATRTTASPSTSTPSPWPAARPPR